MLLPDFVVIDIMCWCDFQRSSSEFHVYIFIFNNWNDSIYNRNDYIFTFQMSIFFIIWIYTNRYVPENGFWTSRCHRNKLFRTFNFIFKVPKFPIEFFINYLFIRNIGFGFWIPVHHSITSVNQTFIV